MLIWRVPVSFQTPLCEEEVDGTGCYSVRVSVKIPRGSGGRLLKTIKNLFEFSLFVRRHTTSES